jgi:hypothetical protein
MGIIIRVGILLLLLLLLLFFVHVHNYRRTMCDTTVCSQ